MAGASTNPDTFKILLATDVHLGYKHDDEVMAEDSMNTFKEVLEIAQDKEVDFVLLGGDLFHHNNPPREILHGCLQLLEEYCLGGEQPAFEIEDPDPSPFEFRSNVSMPVFSIHGNHDEPTGPKHLSVMDVMQSSGLVRYFGKTDSVEEIHLHPLLLKKGATKLALYGVGHIRSNKLQEMYDNGRVHMYDITEQIAADQDDTFSILVLHQNRFKRADNTHVNEASIHGFLDLVFWGHEHESKLRTLETDTHTEAVQGNGGVYSLCQPGSTIATAFKKTEKFQKYVGMLTVTGKDFYVEPIKLTTVRQMFIHIMPEQVPNNLDQDEELTPEQVPDPSQGEKLLDECSQMVEKLLKKAENSRKPLQPPEPLIRIKIMQQLTPVNCSVSLFGTPFKDRVANPHNILSFGKKKEKGTDYDMDDEEDYDNDLVFPQNTDSSGFNAQELIREELSKKVRDLKILPKKVPDLLEAVRDIVENENQKAIKKVVDDWLTTLQDKVVKETDDRKEELDDKILEDLIRKTAESDGPASATPSRRLAPEDADGADAMEEQEEEEEEAMEEEEEEEGQSGTSSSDLSSPSQGRASSGQPSIFGPTPRKKPRRSEPSS
ncbi:double-strand break repair protein MRE11-like [Babylonia areolata]|uniref:double-strand break repair protein MRE11-like n=1 Tax=Babylonia areolata TaxID=304850 RepID=UPI003FD4F3E1